MAKKISELPPAAPLDGSELVEVVQAGTNRRALAGAFVPTGMIDGLTMAWGDSHTLVIRSGSAYVPGLGRMLGLADDLTKSGLSLTPDALHHVYVLAQANGATDVEVVTVAPASPYRGTARTKTADPSRRYLGSVLADAAGQLINFLQVGTQILYRQSLETDPLRVLSAGTATRWTSVSFAAVVPVSCRQVQVRLVNTSTRASNPLRLTTSDASGDPDQGCFGIGPGTSIFAPLGLDASQALLYQFTGGEPAGGAYIDLSSYTYER